MLRQPRPTCAVLALSCVVAALASCRREKAPAAFPVIPEWTTVSGEGWSVELPGKVSPQTKTEEGRARAIYQVRLSDGVYDFVHISARALEGSSQNRKALAEEVDTETFKRLGATQVSDESVKIEAGRPGLSWPARDLALKTAAGATCAARGLFAGEHYFVLSACPASADGGSASWVRMRDSLEVTMDPIAGVGGIDASSWASWSPDGKATLRQRAGQGGRCLLVCDRDNKEVWQAETECRGSSRDAHFVADDCERNVLFYGEPARGGSLLAVKVLSVYARERLDYDVVGAAVVKKTEAVQRYSHLVQGLGGNAGDKPHYAADGKSVSFGTVESRAQSVPLVATGISLAEPEETPPPVKAPAPKKRALKRRPK